MTLTAADGRNIALTGGSAAAIAQDIQNATGLDISAVRTLGAMKRRPRFLDATPAPVLINNTGNPRARAAPLH